MFFFGYPPCWDLGKCSEHRKCLRVGLMSWQAMLFQELLAPFGEAQHWSFLSQQKWSDEVLWGYFSISGTFWLRNRCLGSRFLDISDSTRLQLQRSRSTHFPVYRELAAEWVYGASAGFDPHQSLVFQFATFLFLPGEMMENDDWLVVPCFCVFKHGHGMMIPTKKKHQGVESTNQIQSVSIFQILRDRRVSTCYQHDINKHIFLSRTIWGFLETMDFNTFRWSKMTWMISGGTLHD